MQDRLSSSLEDYLKTIYNLCQKDNQANANKIAQILDVKKSSVSWALKQLADKQLINYLPYLPISLTKQGLQEAIKINGRHEAIKEYLIGTLNIDPETAQVNACRMEHVIDPEILDKMMAGTRKDDNAGSGLPLPKESGQKERDIPCRVIEILSECNVTLQDWQKSVIRVFMNSDLHQSIDGLTKNCLVYKSDIDQDDVQGVMDILCEHRFAEPLYVDGQVVYEHHHPESHHDHMYCVKCGALIEFFDPRLEYFQDESARQAGFRVLDHHLTITGVCAECLNKESEIRSLDQCMEGETLRVVRINNKAVRDRIYGMGLMPGVIFDIVAGTTGSNMILLLNNSRITIDTRLATCIKVNAETCHKSDRGFHCHRADRGWRWGGFGRKK